MEQEIRVFMLLLQAAVVAWQRVTVIKGQTVELSCPISAHQGMADWKNPEGHIMFFKLNQTAVVKVCKDKRYSVSRLSESRFTVSISDVSLKDGGSYTCSQYDQQGTDSRVELTVLGPPTLTGTQHEGGFSIRCTAEGNHHPPQIFWRLGQGPEFRVLSQVLHEDRRYVSAAVIWIKPLAKRVTVKCLVRHPALRSPPLMDFVRIGHSSTKYRHTTLANSPTVPSQGSTTGQRPTSSWFRHGTTPQHHAGWTFVSETTEVTSSDHTMGNTTGGFTEQHMQRGNEGSSSLLAVLVASLIFSLLVVVVFIAFKLRRAHIIWTRENEGSDPSEESSESKSCQEQRNSLGPGQGGLFNMAATQYVTEAPPTSTSVTHTGATQSVKEESASPPPSSGQTSDQWDIKETDL